MIRLGILDFDTSHVVEFTKRLNHVNIAEDQWVDGARVVIGCPGESKIMPERIPGYVQQMKEMGIPLVDRPEEMIGRVDGMLIESQEGTVHFERAKPFLEAGIPCFIDKPFTCSVDHARQLIALADRRKVPIFSSSSLRYAPELAAFVAEKPLGEVVGALAFGPASENPRNPGLFHYGIHAVEILYTLMGPGCEQVQCTYDGSSEVTTGRWRDGRVASIRGIRRGAGAYGATVFCERGVRHLELKTAYIYRELLKQIVAMFQTGKPPLDPKITLEIVGFIESARESGMNHGLARPVLPERS
ncbi:MAG: Gfo/Idh/MocA family oxidoreductase [Gemmataceae bacterium]|nr:Gfo/Idh/MocA family oxidoreductase [Gemmataceae bacterium]